VATTVTEPHVLHVAVPFSLPDDSITTVIRQLCRYHAAVDGCSTVLLTASRDSRVEHADNVLVDYRRGCPREHVPGWQTVADVALGRLVRHRYFHPRLFRPGVAMGREVQADVVVVFEAHYTATSLPAWRRAVPDGRLVLYLEVGLSRSYGRGELRRYLQQVDAVVCVSDAMRRAVAARLPSPPPLVVVPNGVDLGRFHPHVEPIDDGGVFRVVYVGRVVPEKGVVHLLEATAIALEKADRPISLSVVGSASFQGRALSAYEQELRHRASELGLSVDFRPFVPHDELAEVYRSASLVVVPSVYPEPFGMVVLEAMACGTPVIASPHGGLVEAGGDAAIYVEPTDHQQLASEIVRLAEDRDRWRYQRERSIAHAQARSWAASYEEFRQVLGP